VLSGGRAILGVGVGWMREEFEVLQMPFDHRGARADEQLEVFATLFADERPSYDGRFYKFPAIGFSPKPPGGRVPIWVGGSTEAAFRRAARVGDAFHAAFEPLGTVQEEWARVRAHCDEYGRDPGELTLSLRLYLDPEARMDPAVAVQGSSEQMLDTVGRLADAGVDHVLLDPVAPGGTAGRLDALRRFMGEVAARAG
jgi:alkanesulfonate monooxygenase SsuD/methylene tetrahydromethanopterin reductase-like flavin-dependent oxidoreductase (luciferase family)